MKQAYEQYRKYNFLLTLRKVLMYYRTLANYMQVSFTLFSFGKCKFQVVRYTFVQMLSRLMWGKISISTQSRKCYNLPFLDQSSCITQLKNANTQIQTSVKVCKCFRKSNLCLPCFAFQNKESVQQATDNFLLKILNLLI